MDGFSTVDGFLEVNECSAEMIKYVANEPSVGLYYIQQHTHNALPNLLHLQDKVLDRSREASLHTQDLEDSITMVDSMKHCGLTVSSDMINDINKSLLLISRSKSQRGLTRSSSSYFQDGKSSFGEPIALSRQGSSLSQQDAKSSGGYFSAVLNSAKQRAGSIRWPQLDTVQPVGSKSDIPSSDPSSDDKVCGSVSTLPDTDAEELPFPSQILDQQLDGAVRDDDLSSEDFEKFKAAKEAKLAEWLADHEDPKHT